MEEVHSSVFLKTNPPQVTKCTECCSLFHCPLCPTRRYRPQTTEAKVLQHLEVHKKKSVQYEDFYITRCHQACRTGGCHFHCPFCRKTIMRREDTEKHLTKCRPQPVFQVEDCLRENKKPSDEPIPDRRDDTSDDSSRQEEDCKESFRLILEEDDCKGREDDGRGWEDDGRGWEDSCSPGVDSPPCREQQAIKSTTRTSVCQHCNVEILTKNMKKHIYRRHADTAVRDTCADSHHRDASVPPTASLRAARPTAVETKGPKRRTGQHPEKNGYHKRLLEELDEDEYFFLSLVPACKRMAPRKKAQLKLNIMQMVAQAEFEDTDDALL